MKVALALVGLSTAFLCLANPVVGQDDPTSEPASLPSSEATSRPSVEALAFDGTPLLAIGLAGGPVDASQYGEGCVGMVGEMPNFVFTSNGRLPDLLVQGNEFDLTIVIVGPEHTYCQDDRSSRSTDPFVNIWSHFDEYDQWELQIFIGTKDGQMHPFTLTVEDGAG